MDAIIGFEESQAVCIQMRKAGIEAFSCDLKPCSGGHPEWHIQDDILNVLQRERERDGKLRFIGLHPTCTAMTNSGNSHYAPGKPKHHVRLADVEWTIKVWKMACEIADYVYMENPLGAMNGDPRLPKPQIIQPYFFGDEAQKTTCLWLYNLPYLFHNAAPNLFGDEVTHVSKGNFYVYPDGKKTYAEWAANPKGEDGKYLAYNSDEIKTLRSKTFPGIAKQMALQWGPIIKQ